MQEVNMEKHWSAVCALILALGAFLHFNSVFAAESDGNLTGKFVLTEMVICVCFLYSNNPQIPSEKCMFVFFIPQHKVV